jgi:hypothetical protein
MDVAYWVFDGIDTPVNITIDKGDGGYNLLSGFYIEIA